ncbi:hypothetical protein FGIG_12132 [Fasciola gigantica]|uniref:Apple domain-containing protein n=1 Tax=Fasciola gigantica TaxID=46835 RepID=A0A504YUK9_FASGI|nr:hypothetical protein FGIG_12132 [Fasciola gigantica]
MTIQGSIPIFCFSVLIYVQNVHPTCPVDFVDVGEGVCMMITKLSASFCDAHAYCETQGIERGLRLFMPSKNAASLLQMAPISSRIFTGCTQLLNRSGIQKMGWRYSDPGWSEFVTGSDDALIPWAQGEPNYETELVTAYVQHLLYNIAQDRMKSTHVICELSNRTYENYMDYMSFDWPYPMPSMFINNANNFGCFTQAVEQSIGDCCKRCKQRTVCRSFYYHNVSGYCMLSLYVDSLLPVNYSGIGGTWWRFGRPFW